jgi:hypothetical protein
VLGWLRSTCHQPAKAGLKDRARARQKSLN